MDAEQLEQFRQVLLAKKNEVEERVEQLKNGDIHTNKDDLYDDVDAASVDADHSLLFRIRGREAHLIKKINEALEQIDNGTYGICAECGEEINIERLKARPVAPLCIACKEEQEKMEKRKGR
ncbi:MAG: RNA polymerase-binding protein DksA [Deltaproteobacteria bacterium]|nr:RNA polymerase-binding protein DksA [Deltaproteobacteria bacterium]